MGFFSRNIYSNIFEQKFSKPSNLISNKALFEIKFEGLENLLDESVLKSFYFFVLMSNKLPTFRGFKSRYHLGKTFYDFRVFITLNFFSRFVFLGNFFENHIIEPHKVIFNSAILDSVALLKVVDLKIFYLVESNPHFFKWDRELNVAFYLNGGFKKVDLLDVYFWDLNNLNEQNYNNFWNYVV